MAGKDSYVIGDQIPGTNYTFVRVLGRGSQGVVFEVRDLTLQVHFAMKLLASDLAQAGKGVAALQKEAQILAQHRNPHIVRVMGAGVTKERPARPYFVMDLLEGASLYDLLQSSSERRIPIRTAINLAIQVLEGLDAAHTHRTHSIVHRDIKPSNIWVHIVSPVESNAVILDLGIAKLLEESHLQQTGKHFVGTFEYAAPEQYTGQAVPQTDLYAVAGTLFQMITGRRVFMEKDPNEIVRAHLIKEPPRMSSIIAVPEELDTYVAMGLEKSPFKRPRSAFEFARQLKSIRDVLEIREERRVLRDATDVTPMGELFHQVEERRDATEALLRTAAEVSVYDISEAHRQELERKYDQAIAASNSHTLSAPYDGPEADGGPRIKTEELSVPGRARFARKRPVSADDELSADSDFASPERDVVLSQRAKTGIFFRFVNEQQTWRDVLLVAFYCVLIALMGFFTAIYFPLTAKKPTLIQNILPPASVSASLSASAVVSVPERQALATVPSATAASAIEVSAPPASEVTATATKPAQPKRVAAPAAATQADTGPRRVYITTNGHTDLMYDVSTSKPVAPKPTASTSQSAARVWDGKPFRENIE
jgi:serine/threonine protein kinase